MDITQKILNTEEVNYSSDLNKENLKKKIEDLFKQKSLRVAGKLTSENEFTAYDNLFNLGWNMPYQRKKSAYLKGKITAKENGSLIKLKINPNSYLPIFAIMATIGGVFIILFALLISKDSRFFLIVGLISIALGFIYYPVSTLLRNRLKNKIVRVLDLNEV